MASSARRDNHDLLFSGRSNGSQSSRALGGPIMQSARQEQAPQNANMHEQYGLSEEGSDPLQLEHVLGYSGTYRRTLHTVANDDETFIKSMGSLISVENINEPQSQRFLRGHDMTICSLAVSPSGTFIASGQEGTKHHKGSAAPVFLWETSTGRRVGVLRGLSMRANVLAFSPDEQFICGCDEDGLMYIWDLSTGEVAFGQKQPNPVTVLIWADIKKVNHNNAYELVIGMQSSLYQALLTYDNMRMQWSLKLTPYQVPPSGGLIRTMLSIALSDDRIFVFVGTGSGEVMVYRRDTLVFRACIPICSNGVQDMVVLADGQVVCGGGDGLVVRIRGRDMSWQKVKEQRLESAVRSLSACTNNLEMLVSCASGAVYRMLLSDFTYNPLTISNNSAVTCISCSTQNLSYFATGTQSGEVRVWDLAEYECLSAWKEPKSGAVLCLQMMENNHVLSGWQDGSVRCSNLQGQQVWYVPTAHRDGTTSLFAYLSNPSNPLVPPALQYFVTGGMDGAIRVWKLSNRELITQYTEHRKAVARVLVDVQSPNIVHSVGVDASVLSYDLKANKRIVCHIMTSGIMTCMTQRFHREYELITSDSLGRLLYWDIDYRDPVVMVQDPSHSAIKACAISPSGRFIAFAGVDEVLKVLDEQTHRVIALGHSHCGEILSLAWTTDEKQIITGGADTCLSVWNFYLGGQVAQHK